MFQTLNRISVVHFQVDSIFAPPARLIVLHPNVEKQQEMHIKGDEGIIVARDGSLKYCSGKKFIPIDCNGQNLIRK